MKSLIKKISPIDWLSDAAIFHKKEDSSSFFASGSQQRRSVGKPGEIQFINTRKKKKILREGISFPLKKVSFSSFLLALVFVYLLIRMFFMHGGILEYLDMERSLGHKKVQILDLQNENVELKNEIHRIQNDRIYQMHLAREHLGVISHDEFLILFAKDSEKKSI